MASCFHTCLSSTLLLFFLFLLLPFYLLLLLFLLLIVLPFLPLPLLLLFLLNHSFSEKCPCSIPGSMAPGWSGRGLEEEIEQRDGGSGPRGRVPSSREDAVAKGRPHPCRRAPITCGCYRGLAGVDLRIRAGCQLMDSSTSPLPRDWVKASHTVGQAPRTCRGLGARAERPRAGSWPSLFTTELTKV